ncbi:hypothetical protein VP01_1050g3 [Puccinia sorghi]|uniref:Uncharacterized protein n=1 Tax=Puccinia sorghi TaxID=27349 RepID=A0A0L6VU45_9BASI|nr:hypothetical protein VP01_1050g3 [Puccinia sorghi]
MFEVIGVKMVPQVSLNPKLLRQDGINHNSGTMKDQYMFEGICVNLETHKGQESSSVSKLTGAENPVLEPVNLALKGMQKQQEVLQSLVQAGYTTKPIAAFKATLCLLWKHQFCCHSGTPTSGPTTHKEDIRAQHTQIILPMPLRYFWMHSNQPQGFHWVEVCWSRGGPHLDQGARVIPDGSCSDLITTRAQHVVELTKTYKHILIKKLTYGQGIVNINILLMEIKIKIVMDEEDVRTQFESFTDLMSKRHWEHIIEPTVIKRDDNKICEEHVSRTGTSISKLGLDYVIQLSVPVVFLLILNFVFFLHSPPGMPHVYLDSALVILFSLTLCSFYFHLTFSQVCSLFLQPVSRTVRVTHSYCCLKPSSSFMKLISHRMMRNFMIPYPPIQRTWRFETCRGQIGVLKTRARFTRPETCTDHRDRRLRRSQRAERSSTSS